MTAIKERILGAISIMDDDDAETVWNLIITNFPKKSWDNIEEVTPDEWDLKMLHDAASNPDCNEFVSSDTAMKELGL